MITTNDIKPTGPKEGKKLNIVTTGQIANERTPAPVYVPHEGRIINTHDMDEKKKGKKGK